MHFTHLIHLLLIAAVSSTSFFSYPTSNHDEAQQPLVGTARLPSELHARPFFSQRYGRCPPVRQWCCFFVRGKVHCGCCSDRIKFDRDADVAGLSYTDVTSRALADLQNVTTLDVYAEVQPGNNETLTRLFQLSCDKGRQHVACTQTGHGFACGCRDNWNSTDIVMRENRDETGDPEAATKGVSEQNCRKKVSDVEGSDERTSSLGQHSDLGFQSYLFPLSIVPGTQTACNCFKACRASCVCFPAEGTLEWYVANMNWFI